MSSVLFVIISVLVSLITVFSLNWMLKWSYYHQDGIISYVLAILFSLLVAGLGLIGEEPIDWKTKLFLFGWIVILIIVMYLIFWLLNESLIGPMMSA